MLVTETLRKNIMSAVMKGVCVVWSMNACVTLMFVSVKEKEDAHGDPEIQPMKEDDITFGEYRWENSDLTLDLWPLRRPNLRSQNFSTTLGSCRHLHLLRDDGSDLVWWWFDPDSVGLDQVLVIFSGRSASMNLISDQHVYLLHQIIFLHHFFLWIQISAADVSLVTWSRRCWTEAARLPLKVSSCFFCTRDQSTHFTPVQQYSFISHFIKSFPWFLHACRCLSFLMPSHDLNMLTRCGRGHGFDSLISVEWRVSQSEYERLVTHTRR